MAVLLLAIEWPTVVGLYPFVDRGADANLSPDSSFTGCERKAVASRDLSDFRGYTNEEL